jgi:hypothetical protein
MYHESEQIVAARDGLFNHLLSLEPTSPGDHPTPPGRPDIPDDDPPPTPPGPVPTPIDDPPAPPYDDPPPPIDDPPAKPGRPPAPEWV